MKRYLPTLILSFMLFTAQGAYAAEKATPAGAEQVKTAITQSLALPTKITTMTGQGLSVGNITVTPIDDYYNATIDDVQFTYPLTGKIMVGSILVKARADADGTYKTAIQMTSPMPIMDAQNKVIANVSFNTQKFYGTWHPEYSFFTTLDAAYGDVMVKAVDPAHDFIMAIKNTSAQIDLKKNADGTWSGPLNTTMSGLKTQVKDFDNATITVNSIATQSTYDGMDFEAVRKAKDRLKTLVDKPDTSFQNPDDATAFVDEILQGTTSMMNGGSSIVAIEGVDINVPAVPATANLPATEGFKATLAKANAFMDMKNLKQDKSSIATKWSHSGLNVVEKDAHIAALIPGSSNFEMNIDNLPLKTIIGTVTGMLQKSMRASSVIDTTVAPESAIARELRVKKEQEIQMETMLALNSLPQLMVDQGTSLSIKNTFVKSPALLTTQDALFKAHATSPMLAVGSTSITINGLDEYINGLQAASTKPGADPKIAGIAQTLAIAQMSGQLSKGVDGKTARTYKFDLTPDGKMLLNGADVSGMATMFGIMGKPQRVPPQPGVIVNPTPAPAPVTPTP